VVSGLSCVRPRACGHPIDVLVLHAEPADGQVGAHHGLGLRFTTVAPRRAGSRRLTASARHVPRVSPGSGIGATNSSETTSTVPRDVRHLEQVATGRQRQNEPYQDGPPSITHLHYSSCKGSSPASRGCL